MQKTVTIELRLQFSDPKKFDIVRRAAVKSATGLLAAANLISDQHKPSLALTTFDVFEGRETIKIMEDVHDEA